ncbi:hypothetical protein XENOCAPTIV_013838 [Xenoophorus captivus]|uniref:Uncharacterized protein n=1 Tax=Xenoophorus captivus TaxID=1517983 RepID=A0ABV0SH70_9TELE
MHSQIQKDAGFTVNLFICHIGKTNHSDLIKFTTMLSIHLFVSKRFNFVFAVGRTKYQEQFSDQMTLRFTLVILCYRKQCVETKVHTDKNQYFEEGGKPLKPVTLVV